MKIKEIREKTDQEIQTRIKDLKEGLMRLRFRMVTDQIEDNSQFSKIRKDIARLKTVLRERQGKTTSLKLPHPDKTAVGREVKNDEKES